MTSDIENYYGLIEWREELNALRHLVLSCGLHEEFKWRQPCYTFNGKNVLIVSRFKNYCAINFLKGYLIKGDIPELIRPGENTQEGRQLRFKELQEVLVHQARILNYIRQAIDIEKQNYYPDKNKISTELKSEELENLFEQDIELKNAFNGLTPGRRRAYLIHFNSAKQIDTRIKRIDKFRNRILIGKGLNDCVCGLSKRMPNCDGSHKFIS